MKDLMKQSVRYIIIAICALVMMQACEKPVVPQVPDTPHNSQGGFWSSPSQGLYVVFPRLM